MAQTKEQKKEIIEKLKENIDKQKSMIFVAYEGLKAQEIFDFRKTLKEASCKFIVAKKTLFNIALENKGINLDVNNLQGQIGLIFGFEDEISPAKLTYKFQRQNENLKILGGFFENNVVDSENIIELAQIPSREELLAKVVGSISSPIRKFNNVLQGNIRGLVCALSQINK